MGANRNIVGPNIKLPVVGYQASKQSHFPFFFSFLSPLQMSAQHEDSDQNDHFVQEMTWLHHFGNNMAETSSRCLEIDTNIV